MAAKYFSDHFNITRTIADDWFDPILGADTRLFADPFLVFKDNAKEWTHSHDELIAYFNIVYQMVGNTMLATNAPERTKALNLLRFPEPRSFCLGFTDEGTAGSGGGRGYARLICEAMELAIGRGLKDLAHFESLGVLNEGIGRDRISDLLCNVLIERMIKYTQAVVARHNIPTQTHRIERGHFDPGNLRWDPVEVDLPTNPDSGLPIILLPQRFLRALPTLDANDFWGSSEAAQLRADLNYSISTKVNKKEIVDLARRDPEAVHRWTVTREQSNANPYDLAKDPLGVYGWLQAASEYAHNNPTNLTAVSSEDDFVKLIDELVEDFRHFVQQRGGWQLLINDDGTEKDEVAAQLLFRAVVESRCVSNGIVVDREVELGRGPVDFKFSSGYKNRALLEIKKLHNGKFWNGLEQQLTTYLTADKCKIGRFVAIQYRNHRRNTDVGERQRNLPKRTSDLASMLGMNLKSTHVDARRPASASKL